MFLSGIKRLVLLVASVMLVWGCGDSSTSGNNDQNDNVVVASSCSQEDVQVAIDSANDGDVVQVPAGECTWTSGLTLSKAITLHGAGRDSTFIRGGGFRALLTLAVGHNLPVRVTGITFDGLGSNAYDIELTATTGSQKNENVRIDHNRFLNSAQGVRVNGWIYGVIDNNLFEDCTNAVSVFADGHESWVRGGDIGSADGMYIEDNTITFTPNGDPDHAVQSNDGARYIFRYNTVTTTAVSPYLYNPMDAHGYCGYPGTPPTGTYLVEIYENTYTAIGSAKFGRGMFIRGGRGAIYNNRFYGTFNEANNVVELINYRSCDSLAAGNSCDPIGNTRCVDVEGYPCYGQINNMYIYNNTINDVVKLPIVNDCDLVPTHIVVDRDFFIYEKPRYTPYTYPHPLTQS